MGTPWTTAQSCKTNWRIRGFSHLRDLLLGPYWPNLAALSAFGPVIVWHRVDAVRRQPSRFPRRQRHPARARHCVVYLLLTRLGAAWVGALAGALLFAVPGTRRGRSEHRRPCGNAGGALPARVPHRSLGRLARVAGNHGLLPLALGAGDRRDTAGGPFAP